ncbi:MAG: hypothetical protein ABGZ17_06260 [Planctomycetaceae bacterium]
MQLRHIEVLRQEILLGNNLSAIPEWPIVIIELQYDNLDADGNAICLTDDGFL